MNQNETLEAITIMLDRWKDVPQTIRLNGSTVEIKPKYQFIRYAERDTYSVDMIAGDRVPLPPIKKETGYYISSLVGDDVQGCGCGVDAKENLARTTNCLKRNLNYSLDMCLKNALRGYLQQIADGLIIQNERQYYKLSKDEPQQYIEKEIKKSKIDKTLLSEIKKTSVALTKEEKIVSVKTYITKQYDKTIMADTQGAKIITNNCLNLFYMTVTYEDNEGERNKQTIGWNFSLDLDKFKEELSSRVNQLKQTINKNISAVTIKSEQYPVIFGPMASGTLFHEAIGGHLLSGEYILTGLSTTFKDKLNKKILPEFLTIIDNPTAKGDNGYYLFDDDGVRAQKTTLVERGILKEYLHSRTSAAYFNTTSNGHSRAGWVGEYEENEDGEKEFKPLAPEPRVSNLEIYSENRISSEALEKKLRDYCIDNNLEFGLYTESSAGSVNPTTSQLTIYPEYTVKIYADGRKEQVKNINIVGHPYELLQQIIVTGDINEKTIGMCGSTSGGVPVQDLAPAIFIPKVTVNNLHKEKYTKRLLG